MKQLKKTVVVLSAALMSFAVFCGCSAASYEGFEFPETSRSELRPVSSDKYYTERNFDGIEPTAEKTVKQYTTQNGLCIIEKKSSYYEITLDYESGSYRDVGEAYAEAILHICPEYPGLLETYLYENIRGVFPAGSDYSAAIETVNSLKSSLDRNYQDEMEGFAEKISGGVHGVASDGVLAAEEAVLISMVPDALRPTACSVMSANGNKTADGHRIAARVLEWNLGSENQLSKFHCLVHFKNGSKSFTAVGLLGMFDILTAVNDNGVMTGELDVGSKYGAAFVVEGKTCYSYDLRKIMENCTSAKQAADFIAERTNLYTYNVNILVADDKDIFSVEAVVSEEDGKTTVRDSSTELLDGLTWSDPDYFCIINSFVTKGNADQITNNESNIVRWKKYERLFTSEPEKLTLTRFKELMTVEKIKDNPLVNFRSAGVVHLVVMDFASHKAQVLFSSDKDPDEIEWIDLGKMY